MKKILWFDVETTGTNPVRNDPIQIAGLVEINGELVDEFNIFSQPIDWGAVDSKALEVNGMIVQEIRQFPLPSEAYGALLDVLNRHVDKFNPADKFYPAGYNVRFDIDFLAAWFKKFDDPYIGSWWNWRALDPFPQLCLTDYLDDDFNLPNLKLETVCGHYNIDLAAHDALVDIKATRELCYLLGMFHAADYEEADNE